MRRENQLIVPFDCFTHWEELSSLCCDSDPILKVRSQAIYLFWFFSLSYSSISSPHLSLYCRLGVSCERESNLCLCVCSVCSLTHRNKNIIILFKGKCYWKWISIFSCILFIRQYIRMGFITTTFLCIFHILYIFILFSQSSDAYNVCEKLSSNL